MINIRKIAAIGGLLLLGFPAIASAQDPILNGIHKWINPTTNATYVYIPDQPTTITVKLLQNRLRLLTTNNCGIAKIADTQTNVYEGFKTESGQAFSQVSNDSATVPNCVLNSTTGQYESNWNPASNNSALRIVDTWYLKLANNSTAINVRVFSRKSITSNSNDCGFVRIRQSESRPLIDFQMNVGGVEQSYGLDSLPSVNAPMVCRKGVRYLPQ